MELFKTNNKNTPKTSETKENNYNFEKQKDDALKQFQKLYSKSNNTNPSADKKENISNNQRESSKKIKAKFKNRTFANFTDIFFKDKDKTLIIVLIIMLMDNEENFIIIMALIYLIV